jgi:hypothetical protein
MTTLPPSRMLEKTGAGNETRTRDLNLGKVALYQLSYSRINFEEARSVGAPRNKSSQLRPILGLAPGRQDRPGCAQVTGHRPQRQHRCYDRQSEPQAVHVDPK